VQAAPTRKRRLPRDLLAAIRAQLFRARASALQAAEPAKRHCVWVLAVTSHGRTSGNGAATPIASDRACIRAARAAGQADAHTSM